ncbi:MAG: SDR family NAD(P)-dependent oxidoreductase [Sphingomonadales bacterium]|nr:SDR family NAD(P)-dependent oxidoreductase [Sphingomonadales bacterium]
MDLTNKRIVITGGTSGIGHEIVRQLHEGNDLIVISRHADKLEKLKNEFSGVAVFQADLSDLMQVEKVGKTIAERFKNIDVLINNAAVQNTAKLTDYNFTYANIEKETTINFTAPCCLTYLLLPALLASENRAAILNINSGLGLSPKTSSAIYCATKAGLSSFSQSLSYQLENTNVRVLQAFLPLVETNMTIGRGKHKLSAATAAAKIINGLKKEIPENNIGIVKLLRFLLRLAPSLAKKIMKAA